MEHGGVATRVSNEIGVRRAEGADGFDAGAVAWFDLILILIPII